jgi:hypothetical protein
MNKELQYFFENTKGLHVLLSVVLILIIIIMVAPIGKGFIRYSGQIVIIGILTYILYKNFTETRKFVMAQKQMEADRLKQDDEEDDGEDEGKKGKKKMKEPPLSEASLADIKTNTLASYVLCGFILILLLYVIYSLFD